MRLQSRNFGFHFKQASERTDGRTNKQTNRQTNKQTILSEAFLFLGEIYLLAEVLVDLLLELCLQLLCGLQAVVCRAEEGAGGEEVIAGEVEVR